MNLMLGQGTQLGPYKIAAPLGAGGMGEVYRATDSRLDREVAIKVLPPQFAQDPARLARFEREAKAVALLSHPNILSIHDYGTEQGQTFAVMELLEGQTLRGRVQHGSIPWRKAVEIAVAIADGLAAAHAKGITHRDLKPENIFLTSDNRVKVLDFGLARVATPTLPSGETPTGSYHPQQTEIGAILGTVGYMSPEQVRGREVDVRSDIFSLGCVLYEMVSGQRAFAGDSAVETMTAILHDEPPDLRDSGKSVPAELNRIIQHCLEKHPDQRFHSARDLAFAMRAIQSDSNTSEPRMALRGPARQSAAVWIGAVGTVLALAAVCAFLFVPLLRNAAIVKNAVNSGQAFDSLAILPLINVTGDAKADALCEGIAEQVSSSLLQVGQIKVRPITSTLHYGGRTVDARTVGRELDVKAVVTGRLRQEGESLVIALELIDARDNSLVWSHPYKGTRQQILDLQDQMARDLSGKLGLQLTGDQQQRLTRRYTENPSAYMLYTEGKFHFNKFTPEGLQTGIEYFQRALDADPNYAPALAGVGRCKVLLGTLHLGPKQTHPEAREFFLKALKIDPNLADAHAGLGAIHLFHDWDWPAAERELKLASENAGWLSRNLYGFWLAAHDRLPEALVSIQRGQELDPAAAPRRYEIAMCYNWMRRYDDAIAEAEMALKLDPNFPFAYAELGEAYVENGVHEEAISKLQYAINLGHRHPRIRGMLGYAYAKAAQKEKAQKVIDELQDPAGFRFGCAAALARIYVALGEKDRAFEWLQKACDERDPSVIWLKVDAAFDSLRSDPRFNAILQEMRLADKPADSADQPIDSLAILPIVNESGDSEIDYLSDGLTEDLIDRLYRLPKLKVMSRDAVFRYKGQVTDAQGTGRALGVRAVLTGRVRLRGEALSIALELVDVTDQSRLWGERYDRKLAEVQAVRDTIAQEIATKLQLRLTGQEQVRLTKRQTRNAEAYLLFQKGNYHWRQATEAELRLALECYQQAIDKDANYAAAWAGLAGTYTMLANAGIVPPREVLSQAKEAVAKALQLDDQDDEAQRVAAVIFLYFERDILAAEQALKRAEQINPRSALTLHLQGTCAAARGRLTEAIHLEQQAKDTDPYLPVAAAARVRFYCWAGRNDQAISEAEQTVAQSPTLFPAYGYMALSYLQKGLPAQAVAILEKARQPTRDNPATLAFLGHAYGRAGKFLEARQLLADLVERSKERYVSPRLIAVVYTGLGDNDQAFIWLRKAVDEMDSWVVFLKVDSTFASLRSDARFDALLRDMGLADKAAAAVQPIDTLAVLPFDNQTPDPQAGYLGDDVTYSLTDSLARVRELKVRPYSSAARFKASSTEAKTAGRELQVQAVLQGSIQQRGENVLIDVELIHVSEDRRLWGSRYQGKLAERLTLQQQIAQDVPEKLRLTLTGQEKQALAKLATQNLKAHELYTQGRLAWNRRTAVDLQKAIEYFDQAIQLDPNFAQAYAGKADSYVVLPVYTRVVPKVAFAEARKSALQALQRDPELGEAYIALAEAKIRDWDFSGAESDFRRGLDLKPTYPTGRQWYGEFLSMMGRHDAAIAELRQAKQLDPESFIIRCDLARAYAVAKRYDEAAAECRAALANDSNYAFARETLGWVLALQHKYQEAITELEAANQLDPNPRRQALIGYAHGSAGQTAQARQILEHLKELSQQTTVSPHLLAHIHVALGEKEAALTELEQAYHERLPGMLDLDDPLFDPLRNEPRFQKIIAEMKFP